MQRKWKRQWRRAVAKVIAPTVLATTLFFSSYSTVLANPSGGTVTSGSAAISNNGTTTTITQSTNKVAINWQNFDIAKGEIVNFLQPGSSAVALNRVIGNSGSSIYGTLNANGRVFLINPNGILFAPGSQINVGSLVASTQNLSDSNFLAGKYTFTNGGSGAVVNQGTIQTTDGGYVALLGNQVANEGAIVANKGTVALAAGNATTLDFTGDGLINLTVDQEALQAQASNSNLIQANGGLVVMTVKAAGDLTGTVVNNSGIIRAQGLAERNGKIVLDGGNTGVVTVSGTLDAAGKTGGLTGGTVKVLGDKVQLTSSAGIDVSGDKGGGTALIGGAYQGGSSERSATNTTVETGATINADAVTSGNGGQVVVWANDTTKFAGTITARGGAVGGDGGSVETSGKQTLQVASTARVITLAANGAGGTWLLDPADFKIAASGGTMTGAQVSQGIIDNGIVTIQSNQGATTSGTNGDIYVNDTVSWTSGTLTLTAARNININAVMSASGTASLNLNPATANGSDTAVATGTVLMGFNPDGTYKGRVDFSGGGSLKINDILYTVINSLGSEGSTTGTDLQGLQSSGSLTGHYVLGSNIDATSTAGWSGGFMPIGTDSSSAFTGVFEGLGHTITGLSISRPSSSYVGLFGYSTGTLRNVGLVSSTVTGGNSGNSNSYIGALVGFNNGGSIINSYSSSGSITGYYQTGGLVGNNSNGAISGSYSSGSVTSTGDASSNSVGGLVGSNYSGTITDSYSEAAVTSYGVTGNSNSGGANYQAGGLVGGSWNGGSITSSHSTGTVTGYSTVGGLVGVNFSTIDNSWSSSNVTGSYSDITSTDGSGNDVGGLVGVNYAAISNSRSLGSYITGKNDVGGLVGTNFNDNTYTHVGTITNSYYDNSAGTVEGYKCVGGLVGVNNTTLNVITDSQHRAGTVTGYQSVGGLVGFNSGTISSSDSAGMVSGTLNVGGLVGKNYDDGTDRGSIADSNSSATVTGKNYVGGLVGYNYKSGSNTATITNSTSSGSVTRTGSISVTNSTAGLNVGGLVGYNLGTISGSSYSGIVTSDDTGVTNSLGGTVASYVGGLVGNNAGTISGSSHSTSAVYSHVGNSLSGISTYYAGALVGKNQASASVSADSTASGTTVLYANAPLSLTSALTLVSSGNIEITSPITSTDSLYLHAGGTITESGVGKFVGDYLRAYSHGVITLTGDNNVNYFSATSDNHDIIFHDVLPAGQQLTLGSGDPTVYINAGTGNFYLTVDGSLDSSNVASHVNIANTLIADGLYLYGPNCRFWLYGQDYLDINTLAAYVGTMAISDPNGFNIGTVGSLSGITSNGIWNGSTLVNLSVGLESSGTITQTAPINVIRLLLGKGSFVLDNASNHVGSLATYSYSAYSLNGDSNTIAKTGSGTVNITYRDSGTLLIDSDITYGDTASILASGSVNLTASSIGFTGSSVSGINAREVTLNSSGNITVGNTITTTNGALTAIAGTDITLDQVVSSTGGDITLVAGRNFINNLPSDTGVMPGTGRYLIYSTNPTDTIEGMTGYNEHYNQTYTSGVVPAYAATGNWFLYRYNPDSGSGGGTPTNEQVETAITHSNQTTATPPATAPSNSNGTGSSTTQVEVNHTGVNLSGITTPSSPTQTTVPPLPSTLQVTPANGQSSGYSVIVSGQTLTVSLTGANTTGETGTVPARTGSVAVVRAGEGPQTAAYYSTSGSSGSLTLAPTGANGRSVPPEPVDNARATGFSLSTANGAQAEFQILYADGAISIRPMNEAATALLQAGGDYSKLVAATGILVTQQNLGASVEAVYLH